MPIYTLLMHTPIYIYTSIYYIHMHAFWYILNIYLCIILWQHSGKAAYPRSGLDPLKAILLTSKGQTHACLLYSYLSISMSQGNPGCLSIFLYIPCIGIQSYIPILDIVLYSHLSKLQKFIFCQDAQIFKIFCYIKYAL